MSPGIGALWALIFAGPFAVLSAIRTEGKHIGPAVAGNLIVGWVVLFFLNSTVFYFIMPPKTIQGIIWLVFFNLLVGAIISSIVDGVTTFDYDGSLGLSTVLGWILVVACAIVWIVGHNSGHNAYKAATVVPVTIEGTTALPASTTTNMVVVSPDIATTRAQQAMSSGISGARNYNTYLNLGPATEQFVDGHMYYVFPLHFDGSGNKHRLHNIEPGYIMVNAEDPSAEPVEHYDGEYTMKYCEDCGQDSEVTRYVYTHGYGSYKLDDATLELDDQGHPFWTITLLRPRLGWTYWAPVGMVIVDAHSGEITRYALNDVPDYVDRVYGPDMAQDIVGWFGKFGYNGKNGWKGVGGSYANRFQVSGTPVMVYTGDGHPDWRLLLTSHNADSSVSKIVLMDAHTGDIRVYNPEEPMGIEAPVYQAFRNAAGQGASLIRANHYVPVDLTLHVIYGHLTWMATYETEGDHPSFVGLGYVDAYHASANNVAFGDSKSAALQSYITQLASQPTANGNAPEQGSQTQTYRGKIAALSWDVSGGQKFWYLTLVGDRDHVYVGTASSVGPAIVLAQPGDSVTMTVQNVGVEESTRTMQSFTDTQVPLTKAGS